MSNDLNPPKNEGRFKNTSAKVVQMLSVIANLDRIENPVVSQKGLKEMLWDRLYERVKTTQGFLQENQGMIAKSTFKENVTEQMKLVKILGKKSKKELTTSNDEDDLGALVDWKTLKVVGNGVDDTKKDEVIFLAMSIYENVYGIVESRDPKKMTHDELQAYKKKNKENVSEKKDRQGAIAFEMSNSRGSSSSSIGSLGSPRSPRHGEESDQSDSEYPAVEGNDDYGTDGYLIKKQNSSVINSKQSQAKKRAKLDRVQSMPDSTGNVKPVVGKSGGGLQSRTDHVANEALAMMARIGSHSSSSGPSSFDQQERLKELENENLRLQLQLAQAKNNAK